MDLNTNFPLRFFVNLHRRPERLAAMHLKLQSLKMEFLRFPAYDGKASVDCFGFDKPTTRALARNIREIIKFARCCKAPAVMILEDDVIFHPQFNERVAQLELPQDWGLFYFGCQHIERPSVMASPGMVRVAKCLDTHALCISQRAYDFVEWAIADGPQGFRCVGRFNDLAIASLHASIPTYAAYPNLIWQEEIESDNSRHVGPYSSYLPDGTQKEFRHLLP